MLYICNRVTLFLSLIFFYIGLFLNVSFANTSNIIFQNIGDVRSCLGKYDDFDTFKTSLKSCYDSKGLGISDETLGKLSPEITTIFKDIPLNNKFAAAGPTTPKIGITPDTHKAMGQFIKDYPQFIYGADQEITALGQNGILDKASANALATSAYNAFEPILLAQATTPASTTAAPSATATTASAASTASSAAAASSAAGITAFAGTLAFANSPLGPLGKKNDKPFSISPVATSIAENAGSAVTVTFTLPEGAATPATLNITTAGTATSGTDYALSATQITIPSGGTTGTVTITPTDDSVYEGNETVIVSTTKYSSFTSTITITENETAPTITLTKSAASVAENSGTAVTLTATSSQFADETVTVTLAAAGTATLNTDYTVGATTITIPAGSTTGTTTATVTNDSVYEPDETAIISISSVSGADATENGNQSQTITITNDEAAPTVTLTSSASSIAENAATSITLTATLSGATYENTVSLLTFTGTASNNDYLGLTSIVIPAGSTSAAENLSITNDSIYETNETLIIDISAVTGGGATENGTQQQTITITNDDSAPTLTLASSASSMDENGAAISLTGTLSNPTYQTVTVGLTASGTATLNTDYALSGGSFTIAAETTTGSVTATPTDDSTFEGDETIIVDVASVSGGGATESGTQQITVSLSEDDAGPMLSIDDKTVSESAGNATFTVTLSPTSASAVTVNYASGNPATALAGSDYTAVSGTLTFNAGQSSKTISVTVANDNLDEDNETATISLTSASGAGTTKPTGLLTINDDDASPTISINSSASITEGDSGTSTQNMTATLGAASGRDVTFNYAISSGTATSADFTAASGSYTISAGATTQTIPVNIIGDTTQENRTAETVLVTISSPTNATISGTGIGTISITDNDGLNADADTTLTFNSTTANSRKAEAEFANFAADQWAGRFIRSVQNSLEIVNAHKAYGYGLDGSNKLVAVVDTGFDVNHNELNDAGKITNSQQYGTLSTSTSSSFHGTKVAGIIAADDGDGGVLGVAPEAKLHLSSYTQKGSETYYANHWANLTNHASTAVAQNNSWGVDNQIDTVKTLISNNGISNASGAATYWTLGGYTSDAASVSNYVSALNSFQNHGVVVYALSNDDTFTDADFQAALPELFSELSEAWITSVNIDILGTSGNETYTRKSAPCGSTAAYCLGADGHGLNTLAHNNQYQTHIYQDGGVFKINGGTSFVAPMVSGAVALLSQAFPNQTPEQWTDRLLASANNNIGFSQTGSVTFGNGVIHGYSNEAGHGIMDIYAALQPIYSDSAARGIYAGAGNLVTGLRYDLARSSLASSRSFGDGLTQGLTNLNSYFFDGLNGGFRYDISGHLSQTVETAKSVDLENELAALESSIRDRFELKVKMSFAGSAVDGAPDNDNQRFIATANAAAPAVQSFFDFGSTALASYIDYDTPYLATDEGGVGLTYAENLGDTRILFSVNRPVEVGVGEEVKGKQHVAVMSSDTMISPSTHLGFMAGQAIEKDGFLGLHGAEAFNLDNSESNTSFIGVKFGKMLKDDLKFNAMATSGRSTMARTGDGIIRGASDVVSSSYGFLLEKANIFGGDSLAISLQQPNRVERGHISVITSNLSDSDGNLTYNNHNVPIVPSGRQKDLAIGYTKAVSDDLTISTKLIATDELNHVKSAKDAYSAFVGFKSGNFKMGTSAATHRKGFDSQINYSTKF
ncbi:S8 family serine peptidase [Alphaproteobacteria bacterium]|nr:S8 family serine peptidase [Alphaproteobacteria bacterium]